MAANLYPAHNRGRLVAERTGYRIMRDCYGYEVSFGGWHLHTTRAYPEALDFVRRCVACVAHDVEARHHG